MIKGVDSRGVAGSAVRRALGLLVVISISCVMVAGGVHSGEPVDEPRTEPIKHRPDGDFTDEFDRDPDPGITPDPEPAAVLPGEILPSSGSFSPSSPEWTPRELNRSILPSWVVQLKLMVVVAVH